MDLVILGLFAEYWDKVIVTSFTIMLFAAVILQVFLALMVVVMAMLAAEAILVKLYRRMG